MVFVNCFVGSSLFDTGQEENDELMQAVKWFLYNHEETCFHLAELKST